MYMRGTEDIWKPMTTLSYLYVVLLMLSFITTAVSM